jgi:hypothetical protein
VTAVRFHRDVRESDLLGDAVLRRTSVQEDHAQEDHAREVERLSRDVEPGRLLTAEIAILDDLPRAPGEALGPLLRILSERQWGGRALPLETAIGTGIPVEAETYADALEPTQLDRFAVQVRMRGLIFERGWRAAALVLESAGQGVECVDEARESSQQLSRDERTALRRAAAALPVEPAARAALTRLAERLARTAGVLEAGGISDRTFGRAAIALMRAHAWARGAERVEPSDLRALRYMAGRRLPDEVRAVLDQIIAEVVAQAPPPDAAARGAAAGERAGEGGEARAGEASLETWERVEVSLDSLDFPQSPDPRRTARSRAARAEVEPLLRALDGRLERGRVRHDDDPGGQPRRYRRLERLDEIFDADAVDTVLFSEGRLPGWPRTFRRERVSAGGLVAVLRDVSASMEGRLSRWAGDVVAGVVTVAARRRMRLGYVEFNHAAERFSAGGQLFHRRYSRLLELAARRRAEGRTSYEAPLGLVLEELRGRRSRNRHVILLTDGVPIVGDPEVRRERALARRLGVRVHTVFIGLGECPEVLDRLSLETDGLRFRALPRADGRISVRLRETPAREAA